jgi:hypothetical protein
MASTATIKDFLQEGFRRCGRNIRAATLPSALAAGCGATAKLTCQHIMIMIMIVMVSCTIAAAAAVQWECASRVVPEGGPTSKLLFTSSSNRELTGKQQPRQMQSPCVRAQVPAGS